MALWILGFPLLSLMTLLSAKAYLRPGEVLSLTPAHVVASFRDAGAADRHACLLLHLWDEAIRAMTLSVALGSPSPLRVCRRHVQPALVLRAKSLA